MSPKNTITLVQLHTHITGPINFFYHCYNFLLDICIPYNLGYLDENHIGGTIYHKLVYSICCIDKEHSI